MVVVPRSLSLTVGPVNMFIISVSAYIRQAWAGDTLDPGILLLSARFSFGGVLSDSFLRD